MPLEPKLADLPRIRGALRLYQVASIITGVMLLLLCAEMIMKYAFGLELELGGPHGFLAFVPVDTAVAVNLSTGILIAHGWFYVVYLFSDFRLWSLMRWRFPRFILHRARRHHPLPVVLPRGPHRPRGACIPRLARVRAGFGCRGRRRTVQHPRLRGGPAVSETQQPSTEQRPVLVVDFGAQYAQLIARRVREACVYTEIVPHTITAAEVAAKNPVGIVLSGGPSSVYEAGAPALDEGILRLGVPTLGICYGFQVMAQQLGGEVANTGLREYGATAVTARTGDDSALLAGQPEAQNVWMSHGDSVSRAPEGFEVLASTATTPVAAFANDEQGFYGVQWHPEVKHSAFGQQVIENFLHRAAGIPADWNSGNVIAEQVARIREQVGSARVICALSGGVDSAVAAALVHEAVGDQLTAVFVDHGLLRKGEREQVENDYVAATGVRLVTVDAADISSTRSPGSATPSRSARSSAASSSARSSRPSATSSPRPPPTGSRSSSSCRARSTPTSSSRAAARAPRTSSRTTTWAACPKTCSSSSSSRCARSSRTRCAPSAASWAFPR